MMNLPKWAENTREERFFTAVLFHALKINASPFWTKLRDRLIIPSHVTVEDIGYEVCMLRDLAHANLIERVKQLEKQTFDLVLTLSNDSIVIIEAKAHQGYSTKQFNLMKETSEILLKNKNLGIKQVYIAGLHSSKYTPVSFKDLSFITWFELAELYPQMSDQFIRANDIYNN
ncbi:hypothetical protein [Shewanella khirikhana]|uniref:Uncharacterized protein n=1 Tax=Shewanella khirikhana TaxID=1965282 RepID=A0ABM7D0U8_9GAMM|nr:hypothetical protein [Shewanella khirikhana]AZQ10059.1 hypothetical protein STH12_00923 [Shewanella khirikhana]